MERMSEMTGAQLSVCIPAYARPEDLRRAIASVLAQSMADLEVVVGDDSGDLESVARSFNDHRVRYFRNSERLGMAGNWTATMDRARGEFLVLLNDDDRLLPGFAARCLEVFRGDAELGVVFTDHYLEQDGKERDRGCLLRGGRYEPALRTLLATRPNHVSASMIRREVWEEVRPLPDLYYADMVMFIRAAEAGWPFYYVAEPLMSYHVHLDGLTYEERRFRHDRVEAWRLFKFEDPECEMLRRRHLAKAYASRAAFHIKRRAYAEAWADADGAEEAGREHLDARERITLGLARRRAAARGAGAAWRLAVAARRAVNGARRRVGGSLSPHVRVRPEATIEGWE